MKTKQGWLRCGLLGTGLNLFAVLLLCASKSNAYSTPNLANSGYTSSRFATSANDLVGQCTWYVYGRIQETGLITAQKLSSLGIFLGNANTWYSDATSASAIAAGITTGSQPQPGAIAYWNADHVAFVENSSGQVTESNSTPTPGYDVVTAGVIGQSYVNLRSSMDNSTTNNIQWKMPQFTVMSVVSGPLTTNINSYQWFKLTGNGYTGYAAWLQVDTGRAAQSGTYYWNFTRIQRTPAAHFGTNSPDGYIYLPSATATRIISLSGTMAFGSVSVGSSAQNTLTIYNNGNSTMTVSSITYPNGFSGSWSGTIAAGSSHGVTVTFAPTAATSYGGTITVNSDATSGTGTISASGTGTTAATRIISLSGIMAFGSLTVGQTEGALLTIYNSGNSTMTVSGITYPNGFSGSWSGTIAAGSSHGVTVTFAPTAATTYSGTITVNSDATSGTGTITASGTGTATETRLPQPTLSSPSSGAANVSTTTPFSWSQVTGNHGYRIIVSTSAADLPTDPDAIGSTPANGFNTNITTYDQNSYTWTGTLSAGTLYYWEVHAKGATLGGVWSSQGSFTTAAAATRIISLSGTMAFGNVSVGSSAQNTLTIYNNGNSMMTVSGISYPSGFSGSWSGTIAAGASHSVMVTFAPTAATSYGGMITVNSDATSSTGTISASGTGTAAATRVISLSGTTTFGSVAVGSSAQNTLTINNTGNATLTVSGITYPSGFSGNWSGPIAAGGSQNVTVTFTPTAATSYSGNLTVNCDSTSGTNTKAVSGTGTAVTATRVISLSGNLAFGSVAVGSSLESSFTIYNTGNSTMTVSGITYPTGFSGSWSGTIAAGGSQVVTVTFTPTSATSYSGNLTVNSDATSGGNTLAVSGTGTTTSTGFMLHNFAGATGDGCWPYGSLILSGSQLYGMSSVGGANNQGAIFSLGINGTGFALLHSFATTDGNNPNGTLVMSGSILYGTAQYGGANNYGVIFKINSAGTGFTLLHTFAGGASDGASPRFDGLTLSGSTLYGMTSQGGANSKGVIYKINVDGSGFGLLHTFAGGSSDGATPLGALVLSGTTLYGMTQAGGVYGTIFKINTDGSGFSLLHSFAGGGSDGSWPDGSLTLSGTTLYGMTQVGGSANLGVMFKINTDGTGFSLLHTFVGGSSDGSAPNGSLTLSGDTFYGATGYGGTNNHGVLFQMTTNDASLTLLHSFAGTNGDDGPPNGSLALPSGVLYGMTSASGTSFNGIIFAQPTQSLSSQATISVMSNPSNGGVTIGSGTYLTGANVQISAVTNNGWTFTSWNDGVTTNPRTITVPATNITYTANFMQTQQPAITSPTPGSTLASSSVTFQWSSGTGVTNYFLYVGSSFGANDIFGQSAGLNLSTAVNNLPVNGSTLYVRLWWATAAAGWQYTDYTYTAFTAVYTTVTVQSASNLYGTVTGSGSYLVGGSAQIRAQANLGWRFTTWSDGNTGNPRSIVVASNMTYTANFTNATMSVLLQAGNGGMAGLWTLGTNYLPATWTPVTGPMGAGWVLRAVNQKQILLQQGTGGMIGLWDLGANGTPVQWWPVSAALPGWIARDFDGNRILLQAGDGGMIGVWTLGANYLPASWKSLSGPIPNLIARALCGNRVLLQFASSNPIGYWTLDGANNVTAWNPINAAVPSGWILRSMTPNYILLQAGDGGMAGMWDLDANGNPIAWHTISGALPGWIMRGIDQQ